MHSKGKRGWNDCLIQKTFFYHVKRDRQERGKWLKRSNSQVNRFPQKNIMNKCIPSLRYFFPFLYSSNNRRNEEARSLWKRRYQKHVSLFVRSKWLVSWYFDSLFLSHSHKIAQKEEVWRARWNKAEQNQDFFLSPPPVYYIQAEVLRQNGKKIDEQDKISIWFLVLLSTSPPSYNREICCFRRQTRYKTFPAQSRHYSFIIFLHHQ